MSLSYKKLSVLLALAAFISGYTLRQISGSERITRIWSSAASPDVIRQMAAFNSDGTASDVGKQSNVDLRPMETYYSVMRIVQDHYVERIKDEDKKALTYSSIRNMLDSLKDPYTRFYEPDQTEAIEAAQQGKFYGIGAVFSVKKEKVDDITNEKLCVMTVLPGSPAEKAGLKTGDVIVSLNDKSVLSYDPYQKAAKIVKSARDNAADRDKLQKELDAEDKRIKNGISFQKSIDALSARTTKEHVLTINRPGSAAPLKLKVTGAETVIDPVSYSRIDKDTAYIGIRLFTQSTTEQFSEAMQEIEAGEAKSLILDLRDNPGGSVDAAAKVASWFTPSKVFANVARANNKKQIVRVPGFKAPEGSKARPWTGKVIVLINGGTSNVAEAFAAALKDHKMATTVGSTSYGQALQQTVFVLQDHSAVGITTGKYLSPLGRDFNLKGLAADVRVSNTAKDGKDMQLARAVELAKAP